MGLVDLRSQATRRTHDALIQHLNSFSLDLKFSAGIWFFSKFYRWRESPSEEVEYIGR